MSSKQRIGVLTFHRCINYGSYWQARALVEGLKQRGHDAELLDHQDDLITAAEWRCAFQPTLPERSARSDLPFYATKTRRFLEAFAELPLSAPFPLDTRDELKGYDVVVVGSDEVWNLAHPWYGGKELFYGRGIGSARLISYAASFGNYSCHWGISEALAERLKNFDRLSVRDQNSYWLVHGSTGRTPAIVLDPVLQWPEVSEVSPAMRREPFVLLYGHGFPNWYLRAVRTAADRRGQRLISIGYPSQIADEQWLDAGPLDFSAAMAAASAVATNFFHGSVFALRHDKPFAAVSTPYRHNKLRDLTEALHCKERLLLEEPPDGLIGELLGTAPGARCEARIAELRRQSHAFLEEALG